jgi:hypothetical protein
MPRDEALYLLDIQESCEKVLKYTAGMTQKIWQTTISALMQSFVTWKSSAKQSNIFRQKHSKRIRKSNGAKLGISAILSPTSILG